MEPEQAEPWSNFTPLDFPPWIRWRQRRGACIDAQIFLAHYPDLRHWHEGWWVGFTRRCAWCGTALTGRRTAWCSDEHAKAFRQVWTWSALALYIYRRDHGTCQRCQQEGEQVDHIVPIKDGGTDDPANLRLLCHDCHVAVGYEQRRARAGQPNNAPAVDITVQRAVR